MKQTATWIAIALFTVWVTGCGNSGGARGRRSNGQSADSWAPYATVFPAEGKDQQGCSYEPNVTPDHDWTVNGSMQFTVCSNDQAYPQIVVRGMPYAGDRICVFPAEKLTETNIAPKPELSTGFPWFRCGMASRDGTLFVFEGIKYNYAFIVAERDALAMQRCLATGRYADCPTRNPATFSRGRFR